MQLPSIWKLLRHSRTYSMTSTSKGGSSSGWAPTVNLKHQSISKSRQSGWSCWRRRCIGIDMPMPYMAGLCSCGATDTGRPRLIERPLPLNWLSNATLSQTPLLLGTYISGPLAHRYTISWWRHTMLAHHQWMHRQRLMSDAWKRRFAGVGPM